MIFFNVLTSGQILMGLGTRNYVVSSSFDDSVLDYACYMHVVCTSILLISEISLNIVGIDKSHNIKSLYVIQYTSNHGMPPDVPLDRSCILSLYTFT